jgi:hypothetical protein
MKIHCLFFEMEDQQICPAAGQFAKKEMKKWRERNKVSTNRRAPNSKLNFCQTYVNT